MEAIFFITRADFRAWLAEHHAVAGECFVGFYKKGSPISGISYAEAVEEALCFGWIDGRQKGIDDHRYMLRFTPRRRGSIWSAVNIKRVENLIALGLMQPAGLNAFNERKPEQTNVYSFENEPRELDAEQERRFRQQPAAWEFFQDQAPSYRRAAIWWIVSAKRDETRQRRLTRLIDESAQGRRLVQFSRPAQKQS